MNNWSKRYPQTISEASLVVDDTAKVIKAISGVESVFVYGSFLENKSDPNFTINDIDIIAKTKFHSGDLLAIDAGSDSPLHMKKEELEDFGFNPVAVAFTREYVKINKDIDPWVITADNKLLHWGAMSDNIEEWKENKDLAEKYAQKLTGYNRVKVSKQDKDIQNQWHEAYKHSVKLAINNVKSKGWFLSDHPANEILKLAQKIQ